MSKKQLDHPLMFSNTDLRKLLIPLLMEQCLAVLIGMADTVMVASCGEASVSGVSLVDSINVLLIQVFSALATGGAVVTSQYLGKKALKEAQASAKQLFYVVLIASLSIMALCLVFRNWLLSTIFGAVDADVMEAARTYMLLSALSYPFLATYNASAALLRAQGNAKATLVTSLWMNIINVIGNAITIYGLGWGVAGAGLATLLSRMVAAVVCTRKLGNPDCVLPAPKLLELEWQSGMVRRILSIGIPNGLENGFFQLGKLVLVRMISTFGTASIAANAVSNTLGTFQCLPGNAVSLAIITAVGQCVGAGDYQQARHYNWKLLKLVYLVQGTLNVLLLMANGIILKPFNLSAEAEHLGRIIIAIHGAGAATLWPLSFSFPNTLRAAGDARFTMTVSSVSMICFRIVFGYLLGVTFGMGVIGVWVAMQIDWVCRITCFLIRFHGHRWETKAVV